MKLSLSLATVAACLSAVSALETVYVTQLHTVTIDPNNPTPTSATTPGNAVTVVLADESATPAASSAAPAADSTTSAASPAADSTTSTSSPAASSTGSSDLSSFASAILQATNEKRALHSAPDLVWDDTVAAYAQAYADKYNCASGSLTHSGGQYGENLAVGYADGPSAVDAWYNEVKDYSYLSPSYNHFTQLVWKSTTKLGCAIKDCTANNWGHYVICSYDPAGNVVGELAANVLPN